MIRPVDVVVAALGAKHPQLTLGHQDGLGRFQGPRGEVQLQLSGGLYVIDGGQAVAETVPEAVELIELRLGLAGPVN